MTIVFPDETEQISTRTLALNRYKRNHDIMNEVFHYAAYGPFYFRAPNSCRLTRHTGDKNAPPPLRPYSIFKQSDLEEKAVRFFL